MPKSPVSARGTPDTGEGNDNNYWPDDTSSDTDPDAATTVSRAQTVPEAGDSGTADEVLHKRVDISEFLEEPALPAISVGATAEHRQAELADRSSSLIDAEAGATQGLEEAKAELEQRFSRLSRQIGVANDELERRRTDAESMNAAHANDIAELQKAHAEAIERRVADVQSQLEHDFTERLATARLQWAAETDDRVAAIQQRADLSLETRLTEAGERWRVESEAALAAARQDWEGDAADRLAAQTGELELETERLRQQLAAATDDVARVREEALAEAQADHAREVAALRREHEHCLQQQIVAAK